MFVILRQAERAEGPHEQPMRNPPPHVRSLAVSAGLCLLRCAGDYNIAAAPPSSCAIQYRIASGHFMCPPQTRPNVPPD